LQQKKFISFYKKLKKKSGNKESIYFVDSVHPQHQTQLAYGWILKGKRKEMPTTGRQKRLNFIGGICLEGHRIIYEQADKVDADSVCSNLNRCVFHSGSGGGVDSVDGRISFSLTEKQACFKWSNTVSARRLEAASGPFIFAVSND